jgi:HPt (histidine-containing phosphotransfer) domain-containing protein
MQAHLAKPVMMTELARMLQRWLPTRIVEANPPAPSRETQQEFPGPARISPRTWDQWLHNRSKALAAINLALADGSMAQGARGPAQPTRKLMLLVHNLAGSAATFGEVDLGERAAALEQALRKGASRDVCEALARALLAAAPGTPPAGEASEHGVGQRRAR